jgi:hypothetical protein
MTKTIPPDLKDLRKRAEAELEGRSIPAEDPTLIEAAKRIHELQVYQTELEMQNESLRLSQVELENLVVNTPTFMTSHRWAISPWTGEAVS